MAEQFNEILDNLDEEEQQTSESIVEAKPIEHKLKKQKKSKETPEEKAETRAMMRFRLFIVLLIVAIALLGILITQIVLLCLK
jgi:cell division septal protein FtsQ